ncbi:MAG: GTPase HflX [Bacteroidales bacterium]|nr:GTPase HflX [Bacteroidales bacterium]
MAEVAAVKQKERVVLVGLITNKQDKFKIDEYLDELAFLVDTAGGKPSKRFVQRLQSPDPRYFVGSGKLEEIYEYIQAEEIDTVVFDEELSPTQIRNIERQLGSKVLDRTNLILDIFAKRARTSHAKTQVELAQYEYLLPRLTRMWTHLSKQKGGIGMKGPGEKEIETDRRIIRDKITQLKQKLQQIDKQKATQRKNRGSMVRVALVGYTNVGKSTLMNRLSKSEVFAENKLFATLDTTVRKVVVGNLPFLLSDTVGFIRKLPHSLVESFKSTLDEVRESDLIVHIVDISHPDFEDHINVVRQTLNEIGVHEKKMMLVFNKVDLYKSEHVATTGNDDFNGEENNSQSLDELEKTWMAKTNAPAVFVSAKDKTNINYLRDVLYEEVKKIHVKRYPYNNFLY